MGTLQTFFAHENVRNIVLCMPVKLLIYTVAWAHDAKITRKQICILRMQHPQYVPSK